MKTSNFATNTGEMYRVSIALGDPKYATFDLKSQILAPRRDTLMAFRNGQIGEKQYIERYTKQIKDNWDRVLAELNILPDNHVFLCHCSKTDFCHRHILAEILEKELGVVILEYKAEDKIKKDGYLTDRYEQEDLF